MHAIKTAKLTFEYAEATNTRLMGVVGVVSHWHDEAGRKVIQIYHLDYEVYGIDGFYHLIEPVKKECDDLILGVTGGLGGEFVPVSFRELVYLLKSAYEVDPNSVESHVDFDAYMEMFMSWRDDLSTEEKVALMLRLTPPLENTVHVINYLIMRFVGRDPASTLALWDVPEKAFHMPLLDEPYTLIKNQVTLLNRKGGTDVYRAEALIDFEHKYKLVVFEVSINPKTRKATALSSSETLVMSSIEAAFNLNKPEFMIITHVRDEFFERRFSENNPEMMKQRYAGGQLYIEFNPNNRHVAQNPYYLNGDIYAMYFFSDVGQLIIASFDKQHLEAIDHTLVEENAYADSLHFVCELKTDDPILYAYINSGFDSIFDYLNQ